MPLARKFLYTGAAILLLAGILLVATDLHGKAYQTEAGAQPSTDIPIPYRIPACIATLKVNIPTSGRPPRAG